MIWRVVVRPEVAVDVEAAARWYDERQAGLGDEFVEEEIRVLEALPANPFLKSLPRLLPSPHLFTEILPSTR